MPHNRWMPTDRRVSPLRVVAAVSAMTAVMLLVAALGEWAILPSATLRELDEGSASRATAVLADHDRLGTAAHVWAALSGPWVVHPLVAIWTGVLVARRRLTPRLLGRADGPLRERSERHRQEAPGQSDAVVPQRRSAARRGRGDGLDASHPRGAADVAEPSGRASE